MIAEETTLPVMLYNIPGRSGCNLDAETTIQLAKIDNIKYIKEASADLEQMAHIIRETPDDFKLYSGDDSLTLPEMSIGDRKSTRLNSSHVAISYAVFCLKKKIQHTKINIS